MPTFIMRDQTLHYLFGASQMHPFILCLCVYKTRICVTFNLVMITIGINILLKINVKKNDFSECCGFCSTTCCVIAVKEHTD